MPKIAILGAGSATFTRQFLCDLVLCDALDGTSVALMDINEERLGSTKLFTEKLARQTKRKIRVETTTDRRAALAGANYVVNITMIGGLGCRKIDIDIPIKYGLKQAIGCTMGPAGVLSGLRSIPFLLKVADEMRELCPDALMLNYHNPQAATVQVWHSVSPVKYIGLCHSVPHSCKELAGYIGCTDMQEMDFHVAGINHMAWVLRFKRNGRDCYPILREKIKDPEIYWKDNIRFEIFKQFGCFNTESSIHMSEYTPYFRRTDAMIARNRIPVREYVRWLERGAAKYPEQMKNDLDPKKEIEIKKSDEAAINIILAMETGADYRFNANVVNNGLIENLPAEAGVEVPTLFNRSGIHLEAQGRLPPQLAALNTTNLNVQQVMAHAVLEKSKELAIQAAMLDPLTASIMELDDIRRMMGELFAAEAQWLPDWVMR